MWKEVYGFKDYIINSETQEIKSKDRYKKIMRNGKEYTQFYPGKTIKTYINPSGYLTTRLRYDIGKAKTVFVHVLMMRTFNPVSNMENLEVNHIDHDKLNNNLDNLEWCTHKENLNKMVDFYIENPNKKPKKEKNFHKKIYCKNCGKKLSMNSNSTRTGLCKKCYLDNSRVIFDDYVVTSNGKLTKDKLYNLLKNNNFSVVGRMFNVSDNTIRKWCRKLHIPDKAKYYK